MERVHSRGKHMGKERKIDMAEERDFRRGELPGKFMVRMLYG